MSPHREPALGCPADRRLHAPQCPGPGSFRPRRTKRGPRLDGGGGAHQAEALEQVGLQPSSRNLAQLRAAALQHPEIALYVVHNLNRDGALIEGDEAPRMNLLTLDGVEEEWPPTTLRAGVPMVVVAGSVS